MKKLTIFLPLFLFLIVLSIGVSAVSTDVVLNMTFNNADGVYNSTFAEDLSGYGNDGTVTNALNISGGKLGEAYSFDGVSDYIDLGNIIHFNTSKNWSISLMFKRLGTNEAREEMLIYQASAFSIDVDKDVDGAIRITDRTTFQNKYTSADVINVGSWQHLVVTFNANTNAYLVYVDNAVKSTLGLLSDPLTENTNSLSLSRNSGTSAFNGSIDEVLFFNKTLSVSEIDDIYNYLNPPQTDYYISCKSGSDTIGDGSIGNPWQTITKANTITNGNVWFNSSELCIEPEVGWLVTRDNVEYHNGYFWGGHNVSQTANWTNGGSGNLWNSTFTTTKETQMFYNSSTGLKSSTYGGVNVQGEFFYDSVSDKTTIYSTSNPATFYSLVVAGEENEMIYIEDNDNTIIDGFTLMYGGKHGISGADTYNMTIINNKLAWIGGTYQFGTIRYGNCVQFWDDSDLINVSYNNISYCYDAGMSPQSNNCGKDLTNQVYSNNIVTNSRYSFEIFNWITGCSLNQGNISDIVVEHNTFVYAGTNEFRSVSGEGIQMGVATHNTSNINFTNNIFAYSDNTEVDLDGDGNHYNWNGDYPLFNYNLYFPIISENFIHWENDLYDSVTAFNTGQGMESNGIEANPLFISTDPTSEDFLVPASDSPACTMSSTGDYVGALPCGAEAADTIYPSFTNFESNNNTLIISGIAVFNVTIENTNGTAWITFNGTDYYMDNETSKFNVSLSVSGADTYYYNFSAYGNGTNNNLNTSDTYSYVVKADLIYPSINFTLPTEGNSTIISRDYLLINLTFEDETAIDTAIIRVYNSSLDLINTSDSSSSPLFINISNLADGMYYFNATVNDTSNNINITGTREVTVDTTHPSYYNISITPSSPQTYTEGLKIYFNITWIEDNPSLFYIWIDGHNYSMERKNNHYNYTYTGLSQGTHSYYFSMNDSSGKYNESIVYYYTINPKPSVGGGGGGGAGITCQPTGAFCSVGYDCCTGLCSNNVCSSAPLDNGITPQNETNATITIENLKQIADNALRSVKKIGVLKEAQNSYWLVLIVLPIIALVVLITKKKTYTRRR